jgi:hypothetical protein
MVKSRRPTGKTVSGRKKSKVKKAEAKSKTRPRRKMSKRQAGKKADHTPAAKRRSPIAKIAEPLAKSAQPSETGATAKVRETPGLLPFMFWPFQIMRMWWPAVK